MPDPNTRFERLWRDQERADRRLARRDAFTTGMASLGARALAWSLVFISVVIAIEALRALAHFTGAFQ